MIRSLLAAAFAIVTTAAHGEQGLASIYVDTKMACPGFQYDASALVAAHNTMDCGSFAQVTNQRTGLSITVQIGDRGPHMPGRIVDVTPTAARLIGLNGLERVTVKPAWEMLYRWP